MIVPCSRLWPGTRRGESTAHWSYVAGKLGASAQLPRPFLICLRGVRPFAGETHELEHHPVYDDSAVLLASGDAAVVFPMATHAYQARSKLSPDVNRDGLGDVGSVRPGRYVLHDLGVAETIFQLRTPEGSDRLPCWRDFDGDRFLSADEIAKSEAARGAAQTDERGTWADSILLHGGLDSPASAKHRYSIGCFTASLAWRDMLHRRAKDSGGLIDLVLANAWDVLEYADAARRTYEGESFPPPALADATEEDETTLVDGTRHT